MTDNIKEIPLFSFVMTDSFVMTENIKEIPLFSFVMNSFVMTDKHTNKQTNRINSLYVVELIATRAEWQNHNLAVIKQSTYRTWV